MEGILPSQLFCPRTPGGGEPEKRLMAAVLKDAIHTYQTLASAPARRRFEEVRDWFASDDTTYPFAFLRICDVLDLEPDWVRAGLAQWRANRDEPTKTAARLSGEFVS
jgi:hypothetical protein